jgi:hypothetical protein
MVILLEPRMSRRRAPLNNVLPEYVTKFCCTEEDKDDEETARRRYSWRKESLP